MWEGSQDQGLSQNSENTNLQIKLEASFDIGRKVFGFKKQTAQTDFRIAAWSFALLGIWKGKAYKI